MLLANYIYIWLHSVLCTDKVENNIHYIYKKVIYLWYIDRTQNQTSIAPLSREPNKGCQYIIEN